MKTKNIREVFSLLMVGIAILASVFLLEIGCKNKSDSSDKVLTEQMKHLKSLYSISTIGEKELWAVGAQGLILHSADAGTNWEIQQCPVTVNLNDVFFENEKLGWVVGAFGTILETRDGGKNWEIQKSKNDGNLLSIAHTDDYLFTVGEFGTILAKKKTGTEWEDRSLNEDAILTDIQFLNNQKGWITGEFGILLTTDSGGDQWSKIENLPNAKDEPFIYSVNFINENEGVVTTPGSKVFLTEDGCQSWKSFTRDGESYDSFYFNGAWILLGEGGAQVLQKDTQTFITPESLKKTQEVGSWVRKGTALSEKEAVFVGSRGSILRVNSSGEWEKIHP